MFKPPEKQDNFIEMEQKWLKHWYENDVVQKYLHKNDAADKFFSFQDGPITANNPMGVHHAWGRSYKDLWQKFHNLLGYRERFQNGFDCQGLWVEVEVEKELALKSKKDIENLVPGDKKASIAKFVELCRQRVIKFAGIQTEQTKRLGNFMDWDNSYFTMSDDNNYMIWNFLKKCYEQDWIYKGHESVPWCPRCETAISQHEMLTEDYKDAVHESIYFALPIKDKEKEYLLVWTTTPWTLPANVAVAVGEKLDYSLVKDLQGNQFWLAKDLMETLFPKDKQVVKTVKGTELVGIKYHAPFDQLPAVQKAATESPDLFHSVVATDEMILPISTAEGTGLVHTAVSAGVEDFKLGRKLGLPMIPVIADNADYLDGLDFLTGQNAKKHPEIILDYMRGLNEKTGQPWTFKTHQYKHRYPACWRCKTELVWKIADEWYISMDKPSKKDGRTLREMMVANAKKINWMPEFGLDRELDWLKNMHDWLISKKNRYWGLSLPIYDCKKCHQFEVLGSKQELKQRAVKGWESFEGHTPHKPYIDEVIIKCLKCNEEVQRIDDVGNPWLDAGIVPYSTIAEPNNTQPLYWKNKEEWKKWFPVSFITESFPGQFKNWFYALIAMSTVMEDEAPFKNILGFATCVGEDGRPMHKSWGNSIEFNEAADKIGVDVMRWMFARQNPADNLPFGAKKADEVRRQFYLLLWNVYKFFVEYANLDNWDPEKDMQIAVNVLDTWILSRFHSLVMLSEKNLKEFNVKDTALETEKFVNDISTWYIRRSRNRVWQNSDNQQDKKSFYSTLYYILKTLVVILSPMMPYITEEIYTKLTNLESVHLSNWPNMKDKKIDEDLLKDMQLVRTMVETAHSVRKELKIKLRQPLASVTIFLPKAHTLTKKDVEEQYKDLLKQELNVKNVEIINESTEVFRVEFDTAITQELEKEGALRDLVREIQAERKNLNCKVTDKISLVVPEMYKDDIEHIKKKVLAESIKVGEKLEVSVI